MPEKFDIRIITYWKSNKEIMIEGFEKGVTKTKKLLFFGDNGKLKRDFDRAIKSDDLSEQLKLR